MPPDWPLKRDDPASWVGPVQKEHELEEDRENARPDGGHNPALRGFRWQAHKCGSDPFMIEMLATNAEMWEMAEQLLGVDCVAPCDGIRGVYGTLPYGPDAMRTGIGPEDGPPQPPGGPSEKTGALGRGVPWTRPGPNTPQGDRDATFADVAACVNGSATAWRGPGLTHAAPDAISKMESAEAAAAVAWLRGLR